MQRITYSPDIQGKPQKPMLNHLKNTLFFAVIPVVLLIIGLTLGCRSEKIDSRRSPTLKQNSDGFWEEERLIYHDIPTRILFRLNQPGAEAKALEISNACWAEFERIGNISNAFDPRSEISKVNSADKNQPITVSSDMFMLLLLSQNMFWLSDGGFDSTVFPLKMLWRAAEQRQSVPTQPEIFEALEKTGLQKIHIMEASHRNVSFDNPKMQLDFGGIAKGYAVDKVREVLKAYGIHDGLVQLGGEVSAFGSNGKDVWKIGIQHPIQLDALWGALSSKEPVAVSTSGNYRQPVMIAGKAYYHILNPHTGWPVSEKILSVTACSRGGHVDNATVDASTKAIFVLGAEKGFSLAKDLGLNVLILAEQDDGTIREIMTDNMKSCYARIAE